MHLLLVSGGVERWGFRRDFTTGVTKEETRKETVKLIIGQALAELKKVNSLRLSMAAECEELSPLRSTGAPVGSKGSYPKSTASGAFNLPIDSGAVQVDVLDVHFVAVTFFGLKRAKEKLRIEQLIGNLYCDLYSRADIRQAGP